MSILTPNEKAAVDRIGALWQNNDESTATSWLLILAGGLAATAPDAFNFLADKADRDCGVSTR